MGLVTFIHIVGPEGTKLCKLWMKQIGQENVWGAETSEFHIGL